MTVVTIVVSIACFIVGGFASYMFFKHGLKSKYDSILKEAETEAEVIKKNKLLEVKEKFLNKKADLEKEVSLRNQKIQQAENKLKQRELVLNQRQEEIQRKKLEAEAVKENLEAQLAIYRERGYRVLQVSCQSNEGMAELKAELRDKINVFVGQSGVGKSTLVNSLMPEAAALTGEISDSSGLGQHTTTTARLYHFPSGGILIDSPGIREFALWHLEAERITWCFIEFRRYLGGCKFRDCTHGDDPGCLIRQAVEAGDISQERYQNYHRILASMDEARPTRHIKKG